MKKPQTQMLVMAKGHIVKAHDQISKLLPQYDPACSAGCDTCCGFTFVEHPLALEVILNRINSNPNLKSVFIENYKKRKEKVSDKIKKIRKLSSLKITSEKFQKSWLGLQIPCSLLEDGKCIVYDIRPISCSSYISDGPASKCCRSSTFGRSIYGYKLDGFEPVRHNLYSSFLTLQKKYSFYGDAIFDISLHIAIRLGIQDRDDEYCRLVTIDPQW